MDTAVVELDALTDSIRPRTEHDDLGFEGRDDLGLILECPVHVRSVCLELRGTGVDRLVGTHDPQLGPLLPHLGFFATLDVSYLAVGEPVPFRLLEGAPADVPFGFGSDLVDLGDLVEEPGVNVAEGRDLFDSHSTSQSLSDGEDSVGCGRGDGLRQCIGLEGDNSGLGRVGIEPGPPVLQTPQGFLQGLGEGSSDRHRLADTPHAGCERGRRRGELFEVESGDLHHDVVECGLERCRCRPGDVVCNLVEGEADGELGSDLGDREAGGL